VRLLALAEAAQEGAEAGAEGEAQGHAHRDPEPGVELTRPVKLDGGRVAELNKLDTVVILDAIFVAINIKLGINFILNIIKEAFFFVHTKNVSNGILNISYGISFDHSCCGRGYT